MNRYINNKQNCTYVGGQFIILSSIFAAVIAQEIESLEDLEILAAFLVSVADELALDIIARSQCEAKYEQSNEIIEIVADRDMDISNKDKQNSYKRVKKKIKKRVKYKIIKKPVI